MFKSAYFKKRTPVYCVIQGMEVATTTINKGINQLSSQVARFLFLQHLLFLKMLF